MIDAFDAILDIAKEIPDIYDELLSESASRETVNAAYTDIARVLAITANEHDLPPAWLSAISRFVCALITEGEIEAKRVEVGGYVVTIPKEW